MCTTVFITSRARDDVVERRRPPSARLRCEPRSAPWRSIFAVVLTAFVAACGGDDTENRDPAAGPAVASLPSADQRTFEAVESGGGSATLAWSIPFDGGPLKAPDHYLVATFSGGLAASPTTGPQTLRPTRLGLAPSLGAPSGVATQVIVDGRLLALSAVRIRYDGGRILKEYMAQGGVVLWTEQIHSLVVTPLSGAIAASPGRLVDAIPLVDWTRSANLAADARWKPGSTFATRESLHLGDTVYAQSCSVDSTDVATPCAGGAVLENAFPQRLQDARGRPYEVDFLEDGDIAVVQGLRMWVARQPRSLVASNTKRFRVFYERDGVVRAATLVRDRTPVAVKESNGSVVAYSTTLDRAAVDSIAAAFVVDGVRSDGASSAFVDGPTVDLLGIGGHGVNGMLAPADLRAHYNVPAALTGAGQTIAVIATPATGNVAADLNAFSRAVGLPVCDASNPCLEQIDLRTGTAAAGSAIWGLERSLDLQTIHALAPRARMVVVMAASANWSDLRKAIAAAAAVPGVTAVSMSFSSAEASTDVAASSLFSAHPAIAFFASAGDSGHEVAFPASAPQVTAVGGTRIQRIDWTQPDAAVAWMLSGGGSSRWQPRPAWQTSLFGATASARGFGAGRVVPDVAAIADPQGGNAVFHQSEWHAGGGTSAAAPAWAAVSALVAEHLATSGRSLPAMMQAAAPDGGGFNALLYEAAAANPLAFHDVSAGSNRLTAAPCQECAATVGFDAVTGLGEPDVARLARALE